MIHTHSYIHSEKQMLTSDYGFSDRSFFEIKNEEPQQRQEPFSFLFAFHIVFYF